MCDVAEKRNKTDHNQAPKRDIPIGADERTGLQHIPGYVPHRPLGYTDKVSEDTPVIQRKPADFKSITLPETDKQEENEALQQMREKIEQYSQIEEGNIAMRRNTLGELRNLIREYPKQDVLHELVITIHREYDEIWGLWNQNADSRDVPDYAIEIGTKEQQDQTEDSGGDTRFERISTKSQIMCSCDTWIKDENKTRILFLNKGIILPIYENWHTENDKINQNYYKINIGSGDNGKDAFGYIKRSNAIVLNLTKRVEGSEWTAEADECPLFKYEPTRANVEQGNIGDCYLLAAMAAVVDKNPNHFIEHMHDEGRRVAVRLYKMDGSPVVITVSKSLPTVPQNETRERIFAGKALWVSVYEKAYVAAGFLGNEKEIPQEEMRSYGFIAGGRAHIALMHITGKNAVEEKTERYIRKDELIEMVFHELNQKLGGVGEADIAEGTVRAAIISELFQEKGAIEDLLKQVFISSVDIITWIKQKEKAVVKRARNCADSAEVADKVKKLMPQAIESVKDVISEQVTGPLGMGKYTANERNLFAAIKDKVDSGQVVILNTRHDIYNSPNEINRRREGTGESMVKGLAGPHAYTLLDYAPKGNDGQTGKILRLKLRNPWGNYGRQYRRKGLFGRRVIDMEHQDEPVQIEDRQAGNDGEFWIDLADVAAYFTSFSYSTDEPITP